jgi:hypothetical protein
MTNFNFLKDTNHVKLFSIPILANPLQIQVNRPPVNEEVLLQKAVHSRWRAILTLELGARGSKGRGGKTKYRGDTSTPLANVLDLASLPAITILLSD